MGFLDRLIGPPQTGSAGSVGNAGQASPRSTSAPAAERAIKDGFNARRESARQHYRKTGDSGPMWQAKADENDAIKAHRRGRRR
ncbi:hypothetical protein FKO01_63800 [Mesorhizobium sp. B2-3-3]|nr:hypothetical protein FKO01_63800 [Mesorhizobium sp. B2-3-3]